MPIKIGTGSSAVEPSELRIASFTRPVSRVMVGIGSDAVPAYERAILPLQPMIVGSPNWAYLPDNAEYGKLAEFTVSGKGKGRFKVNVAAFSDTQTNNLRRKLELRYNAVTIASWTSYDNDQWTVTDSLSDEFDFPEDAKIEVWGELTNDYWENRHFRWWNVEVVPSVVQDPSALIPISLWGGRVRDPESPHVVFNERMRGSGWVDIAATADMGGAFNGGASSRYVRIRVNGTLMAFVRDSYIGRVTQEALVEEVYLEDNDLVTVDISNGSNMDMVMYGWTVDITTVRVEEPVDPAVETTTALTIDPSSVEEGEPVTLTATVTPSNAVGSVTFDGAGETSTVSLVNGIATTTRTFSAPGEYEVSAEFTPTSEEDFLPSSATSSVTVVEEPVDPEEPVVINGTGWGDSQAQFRDALTARGLDYTTVTTIPFQMDTSQATSLQGLFQDCAALTSVPELDTSNVTNMSNMFSSCASLSTVPEMDTSKVTNMSAMYAFNPSLTEVPEMDTSKVTNMSYMFASCAALTYVPDMETSTVTNMTSMFEGCGALTDGNVRLIGKHPNVNTDYMIERSGLTKEPFVIPAVETSLTLSVVPTEITEGESISLTATVTPADAVGSVTFAVAGETSTAVVVNGTATGTLTVDMVGEHEVTADFVPTDELDFLPSSGTGSLTVLEFVPAVETTTTLSVVPNEITEGEQVTLTATVTPSEAVGEVTFTVGTQTSTVALAGGVAESTVTLDTPGEYEVTAEFVPTDEADFLPSSGTVNLTVLEFVPDPVETTTTLTVVPDEIEEGELVTVTATVTPVEAVGSVVFDVAGQEFIVQVEDGVATTTATLEEAGEFDITADFVPDSELDFLPSSATGSVTVTEPAPVELVPMSWSDDTLIDNLPLGQVELLNYTVVGSGTVRVRGVLNTYADSRLARTSRILVNGAVVWELARSFNGDVPNTIDARFNVNDGDVMTFTAEIGSGTETIRQVTSWNLDLVEIFQLAPASYGSTEPITLNQGTTNSPLEDWSVLVDYQAGVGTGTVTVTFEGEFPAPGTSNTRAMRWYHNGVYRSPWYSVTSTGVYTITPRDFDLEPGDTLQLVAVAQTSTASRRALLWYNAEVVPT